MTEQDWKELRETGFVFLGRILERSELRNIQQRLADIMLGEADVDYDRLLMQLDGPTGRYEDVGPQTLGFKGPGDYRKIEHLEMDRTFANYLSRPFFQEICSRFYGASTPIAIYRAMMMNKGPHGGSTLPWHQDAWTDLDRQPAFTIWTALDDTSRDNGCLEVIPGTHRLGRVNPEDESGFLSHDQIRSKVRLDQVEYIELMPGEAVLYDNLLIHRSDINRSDLPRRAFSVCYMDARTKSKTGRTFTPLFETAAAGNY